MAGDSVVRSYASALFDLAVRDGREDEYGEALAFTASLVKDLPAFRVFLETPRIPAVEKKKVIRTALDALPAPVVNFLLLVVDKRRQRLIGDMAIAYRDLLDRERGRVRVEVEVAHPLDEEAAFEVRERLSSFFGKEAVPEVHVAPDLIGGIVFRRGDTVFDGSIRRRLRGLRKELLAVDVSHEEED